MSRIWPLVLLCVGCAEATELRVIEREVPVVLFADAGPPEVRILETSCPPVEECPDAPECPVVECPAPAPRVVCYSLASEPEPDELGCLDGWAFDGFGCLELPCPSAGHEFPRHATLRECEEACL